jgi:hypothetical protein
MNRGSSNRLIYDNCSYAQWVYASTEPLSYRMYMGKNENCGKCIDDKFWHPYDLVDVESELRNQTRPTSKCGQFKYSPANKAFNPEKPPVVLAPECCSILKQNIPRRTDNGVHVPSSNICGNEETSPYAIVPQK